MWHQQNYQIILIPQGIEAQTVANAQLAISQNLTLIPVINKIDVNNADVLGVLQQIEDILAIPADEVLLASAKNGTGIEDVLHAVISRVPTPRWVNYAKDRILIFDSVYDSYKGVICYVRIFSGSLKAGDEILLMSDKGKAEVKEVGWFSPEMKVCDTLNAGNVGYIVTNIKDVAI